MRKSATTATLKSGDIVGQIGHRKDLQRALDGRRRRTPRRRQQCRARIRTLEEVEPTEGNRLQLTIDVDLQKALEDGFKASGFNGASVDPGSANGRSARLHERSCLRSQRVCGGHRSRNVGVAEHRRSIAAAGSRDPGHAILRVRPSRWRSRRPRSKKASSRQTSRCPAPDTRMFFGRTFQCSLPNGRGHGVDRLAPRDRTLVQRLLLHRRQHGRDRQDSQVGDAARSWREDRHRSAQRESRAWCRRRNGSARRFNEKWYAGETISVSIGQGAVSLTPVSMAVYISTLANGGTRVTPHLLKAVDEGKGWKPIASAAAAVAGRAQAGNDAGDSRRPLAGGKRRRHRRRPRMPGLRRVRQDRHGAGHFE